MSLFFTADLHFCHERVIKFGNRPYADIDAMHEGLIRNWNSRVGPDDEIWVLGDFAYRNTAGGIAPIFARLNGRKHLVIGNHDNQEVLDLPWSSPPAMMSEVRVDAAGMKLKLVLCHYPLRSWNGMYQGALHLYGHEHGHIPDYHNCCDVGVDVWNWHPITLMETVARMQRSGRNPVLIQTKTP